MRASPSNINIVAEDLDHPEGLNFGPDGLLYAGGEAGQIYRIDPASGESVEIACTGGFILGLAADGHSNVYACDCKKQAVFRISAEDGVSTYSTGTADMPFVVPNYCTFDAEGNLYVSDSGDYWHPEGTGRIFVVSPKGQTRLYHGGPFRFSNGMALDPEGEFLYVIQSTAPDVVRIPAGAEAGNVAAAEVVVWLKDCVPDGLAFDEAGRLYIACYKPDAIYRYEQGRALETILEDSTGELLARPTNVALRNGQLYFANIGGWHIGSIPIDAQPAGLHHPRLPL